MDLVASLFEDFISLHNSEGLQSFVIFLRYWQEPTISALVLAIKQSILLIRLARHYHLHPML